MVSRAFKLRVRRRFRLRRRQVEAIGVQAENQLEANFFKRLNRFQQVRRFLSGWLLLALLLFACMIVQTRALGGYYQTLEPTMGGTISQGVVGSFTTANPVYATTATDQMVSNLLFSSLYTYSNTGKLVPDIAAGPWQENETGTVYTVHLKPHITWQDGQPLTAADVAFTFNVIKNPDAQSPFNAGWQGITVAAVDPQTVTFNLPAPLSSFPYSLTTGILPQHILGNTPMGEMRTSLFNTAKPVGSGPFAWHEINVLGTSDNRREQISLLPFKNYYNGAPQVDNFIIRTYRNDQDMVDAFKTQEINAMTGLDGVPSAYSKDPNVRSYNFPLTAAVMTFFKMSSGVLADQNVRQALVEATNQQAIIDNLSYPTTPVKEPFLMKQFAYDSAYAQAAFNPVHAKAKLDAAGWVVGANGMRAKAGQQLSFRLYAQDTSEYARVAQLLSQQWKQVGVDVQVQLQNPSDFQSTLTFHTYDALLYGIEIGNDPDVYAYWSSAQANVNAPSRLNFSEFQSTTADISLETGRTRGDPALRAAKYKPFLSTWQQQAPAVGLYQPRALYITRGQFYNLKEHAIPNATHIFDNVNEWMVRENAVSQSEIK